MLKKLRILADKLFQEYITHLNSLTHKMKRQELLVGNFNFLLKSACHFQKQVHEAALDYLKILGENFPSYISKPTIL
jgi:hypothetical protein